MMSLKKILGIFVSVIAFLITFYLANGFFNLGMWSEFQAPQWILTLAIPLGIAWIISIMTGEKLITTRKAIITATICLLAVGVWAAQPRQKPKEITGTGEGGETGGENQITGPVLFRYEASFQYLSSEDNSPIERELFLVYPCPNINNEPVVSKENFTWQLWAYYEENGVLIKHLQMENGIPGEFASPRENAPEYFPPQIDNTSHGPKVWLQLSCSGFNPGDAFFHNEVARIEAEFTVPENQADKVTLANDQGRVYGSMTGYSNDNFKVVDGKFCVKFSRWADTQFQTIFENSETEWELYPKLEWQIYRLDD